MLHRRYPSTHIEPVDEIVSTRRHRIRKSTNKYSAYLQWLMSLLLIVLVWYCASTLSATSSQFFVKNLQSNIAGISWSEKIFGMVFATWLQLITGSILGLMIQNYYYFDDERSTTIHSYKRKNKGDWIGLFPAFHTGGSLCTNLGYTFLSASWVQVIKLTEPVQTMLMDFLLRKHWGIPRQKISVSIVWFVLGTALIFTQKSTNPSSLATNTTNVWGVMFVAASGCLLSARNVIKKIKHTDKSNGALPGSMADSKVIEDTLKEGLSDFVHLSLGGSILLIPIIIATFLLCIILGTHPAIFVRILYITLSSPAMIMCHPTYNLASLLVLSFVSAPIHSLLNSAKRIVCTLTVTLLFGEPLTLEMILGLSLIMIALIPTWGFKRRLLGVAIAMGFYVVSLYSSNRVGIESTTYITNHLNNASLFNRPYSIFDDQTSPMKNCSVRFNQNRMYLCHLIPYGGNFGDEIGPAIILKLLENKYGCSSDKIPILNLAQYDRWDYNLCLFSLGSIFHRIRNHDHVWGTGINPYWLKKLDQNMDISIHSVRGPKTEAILREKIQGIKSIAYGDPGFLIPFLYPEYRIQSKPKDLNGSSRFCFVPHSHDKSYEELSLYPEIHVIQVNNSWTTVVKKLMNCDYVASSSLHGIIVADSLGIPTRWFQFKETDTIVTEGSFKYEDYFESIGQHNEVPLNQLRQALNASVYNNAIDIEERMVIAKRTISSFPYDLFTTEARPRNLVIMIGTLRGGELAWESFYNNMLFPNSADLALLVPKNIPQNSSSLFNQATYIWTHNEYEDWGDAMDEIIGANSKWRDLVEKQSGSVLLGGVKIDGAKGSGAIIFMLRVFLSKILVRDGIIDKYDRFVLTRSDHFYGCVHDLDLLDNQYLWVPEGEDYGGITDRHAVMNRSHILKALDILPPLVRHPEKYIGIYKNPERLIKRRWQEEALWPLVRRFDRMMFTCADTGDTTRWMHRSSNTVPEGVYLKYFQEYNSTKFTCEGKYVLSEIE